MAGACDRADSARPSVLAGPAPIALAFGEGEPRLLRAARPNPKNRGDCYQWKRCLGESIGNMPIEAPEFCRPLGGKSWKSPEGRCVDLPAPPWSFEPQSPPPGLP
jgi:hypothetical protein